MLFAVKRAEVATPDEFVVAVLTPPAKLPLAPLAGGVKVTVTPEAGKPPVPVTVATRGAANWAFTVALCGEPLVTTMVVGTTAVFVSEKLAGLATPETEAATV